MDKEKEHLINLILWYRDEYHHKDFGHAEMIEKIKFADDLDPFWQVVDGWLE